MKFPASANLSLSLSDILGRDYINCVVNAKSVLSRRPAGELLSLADKKVPFFPESFIKRQDELLPFVGRKICDCLAQSAAGATTLSFRQATNIQAAPLNGFGFIRVGEDGRAYLTSKSEHYHASLGHAFPRLRASFNSKRAWHRQHDA